LQARISSSRHLWPLLKSRNPRRSAATPAAPLNRPTKSDINPSAILCNVYLLTSSYSSRSSGLSVPHKIRFSGALHTCRAESNTTVQTVCEGDTKGAPSRPVSPQPKRGRVRRCQLPFLPRRPLSTARGCRRYPGFRERKTERKRMIRESRKTFRAVLDRT